MADSEIAGLDAEGDRTAARRDLLLVKVLMVVQLVILGWHFDPQPSTNGDNALYYALGKSLADGKGYRNIMEPGAPKEAQYPVVFPLIIALVEKFWHGYMEASIAVAFLGILVTLACHHLFRDRIERFLLIPLVVLVAFSSVGAQFSVILLSEIPYLLATLLALYCLTQSLKNPGNKWLFWITMAVSILPLHTRSVGIAFSVAWFAANIWTRNYRYALVHVALCIVTMAAFRLYSESSSPYFLQLLQRSSYNPDAGYVTAAEMTQRVVENLKQYCTRIIPEAIVPLDLEKMGVAGRVIAATVMAVVALGWARTFFLNVWFVSLYCLFYGAVLCLWQTQWSSERFLASLIPFLFLFIIVGIWCAVSDVPVWIRRIAGTRGATNKGVVPHNAPRQWHVGVAWVLAAVILAANLGGMYKYNRLERKTGRDWGNYYQCADWIRANTPSTAVVMCRKPTLLYLRADRKAVSIPFTHNTERIIDEMERNGVTHIVYDAFPWSNACARYLYPMIVNNPFRFKAVYGQADPNFMVLELLKK